MVISGVFGINSLFTEFAVYHSSFSTLSNIDALPDTDTFFFPAFIAVILRAV